MTFVRTSYSDSCLILAFFFFLHGAFYIYVISSRDFLIDSQDFVAWFDVADCDFVCRFLRRRGPDFIDISL